MSVERAPLPSQSGFSLIELMVVVAIIGILSTVAIPNYQYYADKARITRVKSEVGSLNVGIKSLFALYNFYPNTGTTWMSASPYGLEYQKDCTAISYGLGGENDQAMTDLCNVMSPMNPIASGLPSQSPVCAEPRDYLYVSNGTDYQVMGYCFNHSELANSVMNTNERCAGGACWAVSMGTPGGTW